MTAWSTSALNGRLPPALLLMGPTASGKTALAVKLARHLPLEVISVDSAQIYRDMNIGTAKPDAPTLARVPHHLIDIRRPDERYSAAEFARDPLDRMEQVRARGAIPLLVGGTMLYFKALTEGLSELPPANPDIRAYLDARAREIGWSALHQELARVDAQTAARLEPGDTQRIQRALEVYLLTGQPMSTLLAIDRAQRPPYRMIKIALEPSERRVLHERIRTRLVSMMADGLIGEVNSLRQRYRLDPTLPSMRAVGYRQVWQYLDGDFGYDELTAKAIAATRQLAKRQLTWLRAMHEVRRFDCLAANLVDQVLAYLESLGIGERDASDRLRDAAP